MKLPSYGVALPTDAARATAATTDTLATGEASAGFWIGMKAASTSATAAMIEERPGARVAPRETAESHYRY